MLPILTSYISAEGYGVLSIIETFILFLTPFIFLNIESGVGVEFYSKGIKELRLYLFNGLMLSLGAFLVSFILFFLFKNVISLGFGIPSQIVLLLPVMVLAKQIPTITLVIYQSQQKSLSYMGLSLGQTVVDFGLSALMVIVLLKGYEGRLIGVYGAFLIFNVVGIGILLKNNLIEFELVKSKMKEILSFGLPLIPHAVGGTIIALSDRFFVSHYVDNSAVGIYTVSYQIGALMLLFSRSVNQAWSPFLFSKLKEKAFTEITKLLNILLATFLGVGILLYLFSDILFNLLVDNTFYEAKDYFPILLLGFVFQSLYYLFSGFIFYSKRTDLLAYISFGGAIINLILNYVLIKQYGVMGVAYSTAITWFLYLLATFILFKVKILPKLKKPIES